MDKETFAHQYGFKSYETMLKDSTIVLYDHGVSYYITMAAKGWFQKLRMQSLNYIDLFIMPGRDWRFGFLNFC